MFVAAGSGVAATEQGVASALATTSQQIGGALGLAALIAVANTDGLSAAGWGDAAAVVVGSLFALALGKPREVASTADIGAL